MTAKPPDQDFEDVHAADAHHVGGGHDHEHDTGGHDHDEMHAGEHAEAALGPIDWATWGISLLGVGLGGVIGLCLYLVTRPL
jgi:hypothetical protein